MLGDFLVQAEIPTISIPWGRIGLVLLAILVVLAAVRFFANSEGSAYAKAGKVVGREGVVNRGVRGTNQFVRGRADEAAKAKKKTR